MENSDLDLVYRRLAKEGRAQHDPPTVEEVEALFRGDLSQEDAERVRDLLLYYPELARVMTQPAPPEETKVLTDEERAADWAAIRKRVEPPLEFRPRQRPRVVAWVAAATLALLVGGSILYLRSRPKEPTGPGKPPQVAKHIVHGALRADEVVRGKQNIVSNILKPGDEYVLTPLAGDIARYDSYRFDIVDLDTNEVIWSRPGFHPSPSGAFELTVSNQVLKPRGYYRVVLYGTAPEKLDRLTSFTVRVSTK